MAQLSPSILSADFTRLGEQCGQVLQAGAAMIHVDVMDGHFVPNLTVGVPVLQSLSRAFPKAVFDVHLMLTEPLRYVEAFARAGAGFITFHLESESDVGATLAAIRAAGCRPGLAIRPGTPVEALVPWLPQLDLALVMSVEPGFGGQAFQLQALDKLRALSAACRRQGLAPYLEVDGGIDLTGTGRAACEAGANLLVAGSAVFGAKDPAAAVESFNRL